MPSGQKPLAKDEPRKRMLPRPQGIALILCDSVYTDSGGKKALVGLFSKIWCYVFPALHTRLNVFASMTDVHPGSTCKLEIVHGETDAPVIVVDGPVPKHEQDGPLAIWEVEFLFENLIFPEPGTYFIRLWGNGHNVLERKFEVSKIPIPKEMTNDTDSQPSQPDPKKPSE